MHNRQINIASAAEEETGKAPAAAGKAVVDLDD